jgi:hypothetical protein
MAVFLAAILCTACGDPPNKEIQQAESAIDAARSAGGDEYAHDELSAAVDAVKRAHDAVGDRDYKLALSDALDSREHAETAAKIAQDQKATERTNAERKLLALSTAVANARTRLGAAENSRVPARTLTAARRNLADVDRHVQEARTALDKGDYAGTTAAVSAATGPLFAATHDLDAIAGAAGRRGR